MEIRKGDNGDLMYEQNVFALYNQTSPEKSFYRFWKRNDFQEIII